MPIRPSPTITVPHSGAVRLRTRRYRLWTGARRVGSAAGSPNVESGAERRVLFGAPIGAVSSSRWTDFRDEFACATTSRYPTGAIQE